MNLQDMRYLREIAEEVTQMLANELRAALPTPPPAPGLIKVGSFVFNPAQVLIQLDTWDIEGKPCAKIFPGGPGSGPQGGLMRVYGEDMKALKRWLMVEGNVRELK